MAPPAPVVLYGPSDTNGGTQSAMQRLLSSAGERQQHCGAHDSQGFGGDGGARVAAIAAKVCGPGSVVMEALNGFSAGGPRPASAPPAKPKEGVKKKKKEVRPEGSLDLSALGIVHVPDTVAKMLAL